MFILSSRSATVLVIFIVAIVAFCLASVFASMTGPISILPNKTNESGIFDNVSSFVENGNTGKSYGSGGHYNYDDHSSSSSGRSSNVETTTDSGSSGSQSGSSSSGSGVETTTDSGSSGSQSGSSSSGSGSSSGSSSSSSGANTP